MKTDLLSLLSQRANAKCEYCHFPQSCSWYPFQVDHVIAEKHGGQTDLDNLALSCFYCNSYKGPNIAGIDPDGFPNVAVQLFNPRLDTWNDHFSWLGCTLVGKTPQGRATISVLKINDTAAIKVRELLSQSSSLDFEL